LLRVLPDLGGHDHPLSGPAHDPSVHDADAGHVGADPERARAPGPALPGKARDRATPSVARAAPVGGGRRRGRRAAAHVLLALAGAADVRGGVLGRGADRADRVAGAYGATGLHAAGSPAREVPGGGLRGELPGPRAWHRGRDPVLDRRALPEPVVAPQPGLPAGG